MPKEQKEQKEQKNKKNQKKNLPDTQALHDDRNVPLDKVGVKGLRLPITVLDKKNGTQKTIATVNMYVNLPHNFRGVAYLFKRSGRRTLERRTGFPPWRCVRGNSLIKFGERLAGSSGHADHMDCDHAIIILLAIHTGPITAFAVIECSKQLLEHLALQSLAILGPQPGCP